MTPFAGSGWRFSFPGSVVAIPLLVYKLTGLRLLGAIFVIETIPQALAPIAGMLATVWIVAK